MDEVPSTWVAAARQAVNARPRGPSHVVHLVDPVRSQDMGRCVEPDVGKSCRTDGRDCKREAVVDCVDLTGEDGDGHEEVQRHVVDVVVVDSDSEDEGGRGNVQDGRGEGRGDGVAGRRELRREVGARQTVKQERSMAEDVQDVRAPQSADISSGLRREVAVKYVDRTDGGGDWRAAKDGACDVQRRLDGRRVDDGHVSRNDVAGTKDKLYEARRQRMGDGAKMTPGEKRVGSHAEQERNGVKRKSPPAERPSRFGPKEQPDVEVVAEMVGDRNVERTVAKAVSTQSEEGKRVAKRQSPSVGRPSRDAERKQAHIEAVMERTGDRGRERTVDKCVSIQSAKEKTATKQNVPSIERRSRFGTLDQLDAQAGTKAVHGENVTQMDGPYTSVQRDQEGRPTKRIGAPIERPSKARRVEEPSVRCTGAVAEPLEAVNKDDVDVTRGNRNEGKTRNATLGRSGAQQQSSETAKLLTNFGLHIVEGDKEDPLWLACKFCPSFGCKNRLPPYVKLYQKPFHKPALETHLRNGHAADWERYEKASAEERKNFFHEAKMPNKQVLDRVKCIIQGQIEAGKTAKADNRSQPSERYRPSSSVYGRAREDDQHDGDREWHMGRVRSPSPRRSNDLGRSSRRKETSTITRPRTPPITRPQTPVMTRSRTPTMTRPRTPTISRPPTPSISRPSTPPVTRPRTPTILRPPTPTISRPSTPTVTRPRTPVDRETDWAHRRASWRVDREQPTISRASRHGRFAENKKQTNTVYERHASMHPSPVRTVTEQASAQHSFHSPLRNDPSLVQSVSEMLHKYGLHVADRDARGYPLWLACKFCTSFGCVTRPSWYLRLFARPFKSYAFERHLENEHFQKWEQYLKASGLERDGFFDETKMLGREGLKKLIAKIEEGGSWEEKFREAAKERNGDGKKGRPSIRQESKVDEHGYAGGSESVRVCDLVAEYGLHIAKRDGNEMPSWLACKFCACFGNRLRKDGYVKMFEAPFKRAAFEAHLAGDHREEWQAYRGSLRRDRFFDEDRVPSENFFERLIHKLDGGWNDTCSRAWGS